MKVAGITVLGAVAGFVAGIVLNEVISVVGLLTTDEARGWKPVPSLTAAVGAVLAGWLAAILDRRKGRR